MGRAAGNRFPRLWIYLKVKAGRKANGAKRPQPVLSHALAGRTDRANDTAFEITLTAERVAQFGACRRVRDRVHREVTSRQIFLQRRAELDLGVPAVGAHVFPKGGDLVEDTVCIEHTDGSVVDPYWYRALPSEDGPDLIRRCVRGQIPVQVLMP